MGDPAIQSGLLRALHNGLELTCQANDLELNIYLLVAPADFDLIPQIVPEARFEQDGQIHVASLGDNDEAVEDEMESVLSNMDSGDTVLFFCGSDEAYHIALDFINYAGERQFQSTS